MKRNKEVTRRRSRLSEWDWKEGREPYSIWKEKVLGNGMASARGLGWIIPVCSDWSRKQDGWERKEHLRPELENEPVTWEWRTAAGLTSQAHVVKTGSFQEQHHPYLDKPQQLLQNTLPEHSFGCEQRKFI